MESIKLDPTCWLMDLPIGVTIYDSNFELISWNHEYTELGITPKSNLREGLNLKETYSIADRLGVFGENRTQDVNERFLLATQKKAPEIEKLHSPACGDVTVRRIFLPGIGVVALFLKPTYKLSRQIAHSFNNHLAKILINLELASATGGNNDYLRKAKELCSVSLHQ